MPYFQRWSQLVGDYSVQEWNVSNYTILVYSKQEKRSYSVVFGLPHLDLTATMDILRLFICLPISNSYASRLKCLDGPVVIEGLRGVINDKEALSHLDNLVIIHPQSRKNRGCLGLISNTKMQFLAIWAALKKLPKRFQFMKHGVKNNSKFLMAIVVSALKSCIKWS